MFLLAILVLSAILVIAFEFARRQNLYWYAVDQDYQYALPEHRSHDVQIDDDGLRIPAGSKRWESAVVELDITARPAGHWFEPCVEVGPLAQAQCFERGARGARLLVLSPALVEPDGFVALRGRHVRWTTGQGQLWKFEPPAPEPFVLVVLAPHPDDAEIAAFGLYSAATSYVVTITAGNYVDGLYRRLATSHADQDTLRGDVRTWDSLTVPQWGGVGPERTVNLGYPTYSLEHYYAAGTRPEPQPHSGESIGRYRQGAVAQLLRSRVASPDWQSVVQDLTVVIESTRPALIASPHPMLDAHTDHQLTTMALLEALARIDDERATLLLYTNHHPQSESYPYGPSEAAIPLPPWFGPGLPVPGVLSVSLTDEEQLRKLFALEAMHDLRAAPLRLTGGPMTVLGDRLRQAWDLIRSDPFGDYSYYRRAVRPNELFLVYPPEDRTELRRYLDDHFELTHSQE